MTQAEDDDLRRFYDAFVAQLPPEVIVGVTCPLERYPLDRTFSLLAEGARGARRWRFTQHVSADFVRDAFQGAAPYLAELWRRELTAKCMID